MRLNFEFTKDQVDQLNKLKIKTGVSSMKELFSNAFSMLDWAVEEVQEGREIAALSVEQDSYRIFVTPLLRQVKVNSMTEPRTIQEIQGNGAAVRAAAMDDVVLNGDPGGAEGHPQGYLKMAPR